MNKYRASVCANGRFSLFTNKDYDVAIKQGKEILVFCGGLSGGYATAFGANREPDYYDVNNGNDCFSCYSYDIKDQTFTPEMMTRFYRVIITDGVKVYMKTGKPATAYSGNTFADYDTKYKDYLKNNWSTERNITEEEFEKLRCQVDVEKTLKMVDGKDEKDKEEIRNAIKGYLY